MTKHPKCLINEFMQKYDCIETPVVSYNSKLDRTTNENIFMAKMKIIIKRDKLTFSSSSYKTKKEAEKDVYNKLYYYLCDKQLFDVSENLNNENMPDIDNSYSNVRFGTIIHVIVDYENISCKNEISHLEQFINTLKEKRNDITIFLHKIAGYCSNVKKDATIVVRSNRRDAVDHYISYMIGTINSQMKNNQDIIIHILTKDKFGSCIGDFCDNVIHNPDVRDYIQSTKKK